MVMTSMVKGGLRMLNLRQSSTALNAPVEGDPNVDSISNRKIDDNSFETTRKKDGKIRTINLTVVSRDGTVRTVTTTGTNARGRK